MLLFTRNEPLVRSVFQTIRHYSAKGASSKRWVQRAQSDHYTKEAKFQEYKSRAAFKLMQIDDKYNIFRSGQNVVDLGFAPGAWTQVAVKRTSPHGHILGVDIIPATPPKGASSIQANILSKKTHTLIRNYFVDPSDELDTEDVLNHPSYIEAELRDNPNLDDVELKKKFRYPLDVVISDMMANTSGLVAKDHDASMNLCDAALILAIDLLKSRGSFVCKFFSGSEDKSLENRLKKVFEKVHRDKPVASRPESKEYYFVCLNKRKSVDKVDVFS